MAKFIPESEFDSWFYGFVLKCSHRYSWRGVESQCAKELDLVRDPFTFYLVQIAH